VSAELIALPRLARELHLAVQDVAAAVHELKRRWGAPRVVGARSGNGVERLTPAAVVAIRQHFGIGDIPQVRGRKPVAS
jgi:hypothetical protein